VRESQTRSWIRRIERIVRAGFDLILPPRCMGCGSLGDTWCASCHQGLSPPLGTICRTCGLPRCFRQCPACTLGITNLKVDSLYAYKPPIKLALVALKYHPDRTFAGIIAEWIECRLQVLAWEPELILPVPLSQVRLQQRGYNQVELITSALARLTSIPQKPFILERVRDTRSQVGLDPNARYVNQDQAFKSRSELIVDRKVLLIDDLLTSGATVMHCALCLLEGGANQVFALTIARA
jgi:ComF family protein